jgi:hypothetical protein
MISNVPIKRHIDRRAPASSLHQLLVLPIPKQSAPRPLRRQFLRDLSFLLPAFGVALGWLLLRGQSPFVGATLFASCGLLLLLRLHTAWIAWRARRRMTALRHWQRRYRRPPADEQPAVVYVAVPRADAPGEKSYEDVTSHTIPVSDGVAVELKILRRHCGATSVSGRSNKPRSTNLFSAWSAFAYRNLRARSSSTCARAR